MEELWESDHWELASKSEIAMRQGQAQETLPNASSVRAKFLGGLEFVPDPFQLAAFDALDQGSSVLVAAPTGAGKTLVADYAIDLALAEGKKLFYTTPLKALSNQKYSDFCQRLGRTRVGLLTGDNSINGGAPVVVMTTEVLRNMIYAASPALENLAFVVLDEVHYMQNPYRGAVWEEVIVHAPPEVRLVCLSATVSNAEEVAEWLTTVRGETVAIIDEQRPVPLVHHYAVGDRHRDELLLLPTFVDGRPNPELASLDGGRSSRLHGRHRRYFRPGRAEMVERLWEQDLLPAIYFIFSRSACDDAVRSCLRAGLRLTTPDERRRIRHIVESHLESLSDADLAALGYRDWLAGMEAGVASHHAGLVPPFKEAVEECFAEALVKVVFATETLALGINMPARSVVIDSLTKFSGEAHEPLTPGEYTQLTGRAGRRGIDQVGHAVVPWSPWISFSQVAGLASTRSYELTSSFRPTYNMTANLVRRYAPDQARHLLNLSFAQYRSDTETVRIEARIERVRRQLAEATAQASCDLGDIEELVAWRQRRKADRRRNRLERIEALASLHPGEVLWHQGQALVVVSVARRRAGAVKVSAVGQDGQRHNLGWQDLPGCPQVVFEVELPTPYEPNDEQFCREVARRLRRGTGRIAFPVEPREPAAGSFGSEADPNTLGCPDLELHLRAHRRKQHLEAELTRLVSSVRSRRHSLARQMERVMEVLEARGCLVGWSLTPKGERLARLYHEQDLLVLECLEEGLFSGLGPADLASLASVFVHEARRQQAPLSSPRKRGSQVPASLAGRWAAIEDLAADLAAQELVSELPPTRQPSPGIMRLTRLWASGRPLARVVGTGELSGGDFVRMMKQLADLLRQIADISPDAEVGSAAAEAADSCFRGVVAASSVLEIHDEVAALA